MKKIIRKSLLTSVIFLFGSVLAMAIKPFEGVVTYKISYPDSKLTESQLAMVPKVMTISIKGAKARTEMTTGMGNVVEIVDYMTKDKVALMDMMGQKIALKQTKAELEKENENQPKGVVTLTEETKEIAGYKCKKALVTSEEDGVKTNYEVWFTDELGGKDANFDNPLYKDINGVLMEFAMKTPQASMKFVVTNVEKKSIPSKDFEIPAEYKLTTKEELKSKFGGMGE